MAPTKGTALYLEIQCSSYLQIRVSETGSQFGEQKFHCPILEAVCISYLCPTMPQIEFDNDALARFCRATRIRKLALFGSVLGENFGPSSDIDLLVEFEPGAGIGLFDIFRLKIELSPLFGGRKVDLCTPQDLGRHMRARVMALAEGIYAACSQFPNLSLRQTSGASFRGNAAGS